MNISPQTNLSSPVNTEQKTIFSDSNAARTVSKDLASVSATNPSFTVSLSATDNAIAAANTKVPPLYSRPTVSETNQNRLRTDELNETDKKSSVIAARENKEAESRRESGSENTDDYLADEPEEEARVEAQNRQDKDRDTAAKDKSEQRADEREPGSTKLTDEEQQIVNELSARDKEVRAHEQAHKAVGGQYTGAISYSFQSGPDNKRYAVGGEVPIDVSEIPDNPQATISKMQTVKAAALAPAEPSTQDRAVAATAARILSEAQADLAKDQREELELAKEKAAEKTNAQNDDKDDSSNQVNVESFQEISTIDQEDVPAIDTII